MRNLRILPLACLLLTCAAPVPETVAAEPRTGPVLDGFGPVYDVDDPAHAVHPRKGVRAVFDVAEGARTPGTVNARIETVARFLNMHARAGFPRARTEAALVLHGAATEAALNDAAYRSRHGTANPDLELVSALRRAGVRIYVCGQSAAYRGIDRAELSGDVQLALSAMTALTQLQSSGYALIAF